jgi:hypothetical protein
MNEDSAATSLGSVPKSIERTPEQRAEWARRFCESGLSLRKFSAQHGLHWCALWRWVKTREKALEKENDFGPGAAIGFAEIQMAVPSPPPDWVAEITFADGRVLRFSKDVPSSTLEQLLRVC